MKKILLNCFAVLSIGAALLISGCKKYDSDIEEINDRLAKLEQTVSDIETQINAGVILTNVTSTSNGIQISLSNGKTYDITNGKDGSVITIGENNNWYIDGVDTGKRAVGKDAIVWYPNEDGYWHYIDPESGEDIQSEQKWLTKEYITAVYDNYTITLYNVDYAEEGKVVIKLMKVQSLTWVPTNTANLGIFGVGYGFNYDYIKAIYLSTSTATVSTYDDAHLVGAFANVKLRVSPASMASQIKAEDLQAVVDKVETKAETTEPTATIVDVKDLEDGKGTILVSLSFKDFTPWNASESDQAEYVTAGIKYVNASDEISSDNIYFYPNKEQSIAAVPVYGYMSSLEGFITAASSTKYYNVPWDTKAENSVVALGGDSEYRENPASWFLHINNTEFQEGEDIYITFDMVPTYFNKNIHTNITGATFDYVNAGVEVEEDESVIKVTEPETICWEEGIIPTAEFKNDLAYTDVYSNVTAKYTFGFAMGDDNDVAMSQTLKFYYKVIPTMGTDYEFGTATADWKYSTVKAGYPETTTPAFEIGTFDVTADKEIQLSDWMDEDTDYALNVYSESGIALYKVATCRLYQEDGKQQIKITSKKDNFEWGKTYEVELRETVNQIGYVIRGSITFGEAPANFVDEAVSANVELNEEGMSYKTNPWDACYEQYKNFFDSKEEFIEAVLDEETVSTMTTIRTSGEDQEEMTESVMSVDESTNDLSANVAYDEVNAAGDVFDEKASFKTWFGNTFDFNTILTVTEPEE